MPPSPPALARRVGVPPSVPSGHGLVTVGGISATIVSAMLRAAAAALSGLLLCGGVALLLWAVTPGSGSDAVDLLHGGVVVFASAHFLPVTVSGVSVTVRPLLLTGIVLAVIASSAGRARPARGRTLEALHGSVLALAYAVLVDVISAALAPPGAVQPGLLAPLCVAAVGVVMALALHRTAWNRWWRSLAPDWLWAGLRAAAAGACLLAAAGALAVTVGLVRSFSDATAIAGLTAHSAGDGFGQLLLGLAFLPNAVVAGIGYVTGAGFTLGAASYSPLGVRAAELPAIPLLAAAPSAAPSTAALGAFLGPLVAAALMVVIVVRSTHTRRARLAAAAVASMGAGLLVSALAAAAAGGVAGGPWASSGVPALLAGGMVAGALLVLCAAGSAVGWRGLPWTVDRAPDAGPGPGDDERVAAGTGVLPGGTDEPGGSDAPDAPDEVDDQETDAQGPDTDDGPDAAETDDAGTDDAGTEGAEAGDGPPADDADDAGADDAGADDDDTEEPPADDAVAADADADDRASGDDDGTAGDEDLVTADAAADDAEQFPDRRTDGAAATGAVEDPLADAG